MFLKSIRYIYSKSYAMETNITDRKNLWKLTYASIVASEYKPNVNPEDYEHYDAYVKMYISDLNKIEREELDFRQIFYSDTIQVFVKEYETGKTSIPFTYKGYCDNKNIIGTIKAFGLDVEKFWYAVVFIYWLTEKESVNVVELKETIGEQMQKLLDFLQGIHSFTIATEGKKNISISDTHIIRSLREFISESLERDKDILNSYSINLSAPTYGLLSLSKQMFFAATRYIKLLKNLELPPKPARADKTISSNKMLLISRLMHFYRFTDNENFLNSDESLKGIIKQYKDVTINTVNPRHLF